MKTKLLLAFLILFGALNASHIEGRISMEYVGASTGVANQYKIKVILFGDIYANGIPSSVSVDLESSCQAQFSIILAQDTFLPHIPSMVECASTISPNQSPVELKEYSGYAIIPPCSDWKISYQDCCRGYYNNTVSNSIATYLQIHLNNLYGHNSIAEVEDKYQKIFCVNKEVHWERNYVDAESDSLYITTSPVYIQSSNGQIPVVLDSGYTYSTPMRVDSTIGFNVNPNNGNLRFKPTEVGRYLIGFEIQEFRYDSIYNIAIQVAKHYDELVVLVSDSCHLPNTINMTNGDTLTMNCGVLNYNVELANTYYASSLTATDFALYAPSGPPVPIVKAETQQVYQGKSDNVDFTFHYPIQENGIHKLELRIGADGNTLILPCGVEFDKTEFVYIKVSDCSSVNINEPEISIAKVYPNPAKNELRVDLNAHNKECTLNVFNLQGVLVLKQTLTKSSNVLDINQLSSGSYVVQLNQEANVQRVPLIIVN